MSIPKRSHGKLFLPNNFVRTVAKAIEDAGFEVHLVANALFELSFLAANGDRIAVRCILTSRVVNSDKKIRDWLDQISKSRPPIKETLLVANSVPTESQHFSAGFHGFELLHYKDLRKFLERYKRPRAKPNPKRKSQTTRIASTVKANRNQILIATEALALQIDDKLAKLKTEKPNDPDTVAALKSQVFDYEALRAQVATLQQAVAKLTASAKSKEQTAEAAMSEQTAREHSRQISRDGPRTIGRWSVFPVGCSSKHGNCRRYGFGGWEIRNEGFERDHQGQHMSKQQSAKRRQCVFCGQATTKQTKEHILPQWLLKLTGDPSRLVTMATVFRRICTKVES
jgi:hypothetical protein